MRCEYCGYYWADRDEDGRTISNAYCHFEGFDGWAPCEQEEMEPIEWADDGDADAWIEAEMDRNYGDGWR